MLEILDMIAEPALRIGISSRRRGVDAMNRTVLGLLFAVCSTAHLSSQMGNMNAPTFTKDVAPILQKNCQTCHRPGDAPPFSLLTYEQSRPWAKAIKSAVLTKKMP